VRIAPELGNLKKLTVRYPHPLGMIEAHYEVTGSGVHAEITLPPGLSGTWEWHGKSHPLAAGKAAFDVQ
jgi:hypothetical protein